MQELIGTGVALVTPFKDDLTIDHQALEKLVEYNIKNGTDYLVVSGTTAESVTIDKHEKIEILNTVLAVNGGRLPVVLGIGGNNTAAIIKEIEETDLSKVTAILSVAPYYNKPTQAGLYAHFAAVAESTDKPLILYNVPGRTSKNMEPATTMRLAEDFKNIVAVKEAGNNVQQYLQLLKDKPEDFLVISGDDDLALGIVLAGGAGVISVIGQAFPELFSRMVKFGLEGNARKAYDLHFKLMDLTSDIFAENNPAGIKAVLEQLGICNASVRLPLVQASDSLKKQIRTHLLELQMIEA